MKHLFIINKTAGKNESYKPIEAQIEKIENKNDIDVLYTERPGHATELARNYMKNTDEFVRIYACGGDGTINEVVSGVYDLPRCAIAPVPIGSGNDFVRSFGCEKEDFLSLRKMKNGRTVTVDLLRCELLGADDRICCNSITIGYDCAVAKNVEKFKNWKLITSSFAYKLSIFYCLFKGRKHNFKIKIDSEDVPHKGTYLLSLCAKGKYYGGGIKCAPKADNGDEMIDFMMIPTIGVLKFIRFLPSFAKGEHIDNPKAKFITHMKCHEVEYVMDKANEIGIDGEILTVNGAKISVIPQAVNIVIPM